MFKKGLNFEALRSASIRAIIALIMYSSKHVARLFDTTSETIRVWTIEFARYMSPTAVPDQGRHRRFTDDDLKVLALIAAMKAEGLLFEDIHVALASGQRAEPPITDTALQQIPQTSYLDQLRIERDELLLQLSDIQTRYARLEGRLEQTTTEKETLRMELAALREEVARLNRENAILNYRLEQSNDK